MTVKQQIINALTWFKSKLVGSIVNNCTSTSTSLPLSAAQGKSLQDQITTLNTNLPHFKKKEYAVPLSFDSNIQRWTGTVDLLSDVPSGQIISTLTISNGSSNYETAIPSWAISNGKLVCSYHMNGTYIGTVLWIYL